MGQSAGLTRERCDRYRGAGLAPRESHADLKEVRRSTAGPSAFIRGTRVRVADFVQLYLLLQQEVVVERLLRSLPDLTPEQVHAALDCSRSRKEEIELEVEAEEEILTRPAPT